MDRDNVLALTHVPRLISRAFRTRSHRVWLAAVVVVMALLGSLVLWVWRIRDVSEVPDVGDPFDVARAARPVVVDDESNAQVLYARAHELLRMAAQADYLRLRNFEWADQNWSTVAPQIRDVVASNREALALWLEASGRPEAVLLNTSHTLRWQGWASQAVDLEVLCRLALLEGSRLEESGELAEAWAFHVGVLRSSRHMGRHGSIMQRLLAARVHEKVSLRIEHWARDPRVDASLLRRALRECQAADALTAPLSSMLEQSYLILIAGLDGPASLVDDLLNYWPPRGGASWVDHLTIRLGKTYYQGYRKAHIRAVNDVERSRRVLRILFANWLSQVDRPDASRAPLAIRSPVLIYAPEPTQPPGARAIAPEALLEALDRTCLARFAIRSYSPEQEPDNFMNPSQLWEGEGVLARERRRRSNLILLLAAKLYQCEQGRPPVNAGDLIGPDLPELPEGITPDAPIPSSLK